MALSSNQRFGLRILAGLLGIWFIKSMLFSSSERNPSVESEIAIANVFERVTSGTPLGSSALNPQRYPFLQSRIGRDDTQDLFDTDIHAGLEDFWQRFQLPFATAPETIHLDEQVIKGTVEELLSFNGWAAAACTTLTRPYASDSEDPYADLTKPGQRYFFALVVHSADHFFIDQLAVVVQAARKLGTQAIFVSVVDYASTDSIPFLCDLAEAVMVLLGIPFRIRRVPPMTSDPAASYYPLEEAYTRNLALEPLFELYERRQVSFIRVIWLKGFTCPDDILETLRISIMNQAAMVCGMDWKEHNGFFIYNDRWRTRDLDGNLFRGSKSTSPIDEAPPRDAASAARYQQHLPYQVFCCESGSHIVDPMMTYYAGIHYRSSVAGVFNITSAGSGKSPVWTEGPCMDSSQMHFCRDIWLMSAKEGVKEAARDAKQRDKAGKPRGLSRELEDLIRVVAPRLSIPVEELPQPTRSSPPSKSKEEHEKHVEDKQGNIDLVDHNALLPEADFDQTDGVGAGRDLAANEEKEAAKKKEQEDAGEQPLVVDEKSVGGKPLPKGQQKFKRDELVQPPVEQTTPEQDQSSAKVKSTEDSTQSSPSDNQIKQGDPTQSEKVGESQADGGEKKVDQAEESTKKVTIPVEEEYGYEEEEEEEETGVLSQTSTIPNSAFKPARILVNPRCITTYAGVSHTKLALDLFGSGDDVEPSRETGGKYHFSEEKFIGAPNAFVCQEMRTTGGRLSTKQQRRTNFHISKTLRAGWRPGDYV
ncbi:hypothetical protein MJO28_010884 [Puccinia striiformis f. sp. tritici]|uniref:Uncharacterized protein n=1 Tax=Puccinia striiformis f. sp. tritici TaxID=168172 RepID=A0ACC0E7C8_9BASI|nr:hypothetical protein Pst134EB_020609 [Puccinia striiformis f. sp. tritici]KAH9449810.1 hypothetical protein Pst134EB_020622 [Puccinia striiformis f. sp. tritici]KAI7945189.1 hypothetical protein MJO28_010884 [Puccinia striiformis f. sp. tritici]KAI7948958.1 hypothetical protein MJO29_010623 [Puccinia striiformis f. sp. tritici]KAI9619019.1 hypothetical protein KEM48_006490 [Puccinia striiformis f. sp. tritici PST-130]